MIKFWKRLFFNSPCLQSVSRSDKRFLLFPRKRAAVPPLAYSVIPAKAGIQKRDEKQDKKI
jgi:hypothetical protein